MWAYQFTPHDNWDYDAVSTMVLADLKIGGQMRKALVTFNKNGFQYTLDRATGEVLVGAALRAGDLGQEHRSQDRQPGARFHQADRRIQGQREGHLPQPRGRREPGVSAGVLAADRLFYTSTNNMCMDYAAVPARSTSAARPSSAQARRTTPAPVETSARSWRGMQRPARRCGRIKEHFPNWSGALVTAGDVAFYGTLDGWFKAVDAKTGKLLSKFKVGSGVVGNPITYRGPDGKQYVAVYAGIGGDWFLLAGDVRSDDPADVRPPSDRTRTSDGIPARAASSGSSGSEGEDESMPSRHVFALLAGTVVAAAACKAGGERKAQATGTAVTAEDRIIAGGVAPAANALSAARPAKPRPEWCNLFGSMNCDGCHGGGAIGWVGPSLVDGRWRYGGTDEEIFTSIFYGRPKGMPAYGGVIGTEECGCWWPTSRRRRFRASYRPHRGCRAATPRTRRPRP